MRIIRSQRFKRKGNKHLPSYIRHQTSDISVAAVPVYLQSVSNLCNQLLRAGTSIGANNAEATSAISKADFKSKSYIALKEARESLYWLELLHRNNYLTDIQFNSLYADGEELVKVLTHRCKKLDNVGGSEKWRHHPSYFKHHTSHTHHLPNIELINN